MRSTTARPGPRVAARRLRRRVRTAVTAVVLGAVAVGGLVAVAPAQAATVAPKLKVVAGDHALTAAWSGVSGAGSYTVRISKKKSLSHAKVVTTTKRSVKVTKLSNGTPYYVAVTPNRVAFSAAIARSAVVKTKAAAGVPLPVSKVTVVPGPAADQVTVNWTGGGRATKVAVVAGSSVLTNERSFHSAWYPATTRSITLTVPAKYQQFIGAGTGNPVWVKVVQSNGSSSAFGASYDYGRKYRPSPPGTWAFAKATPAPADVDKLVVAELNTQTVEATSGFHTVNKWAARAPRVANYIKLADPDLLLTAELSTGLVRQGCQDSIKYDTYPCAADTQYQDLANRLPKLTLADPDAYQRVRQAMRLDDGKWQQKITSGSHIFYNAAKLDLLGHGFFAPARAVSDTRVEGVQGLGVSPWDPKSAVSSDRWLSWAKFQVIGSGRQFYAVAAHLPVGDSPLVVNTRAQETAKLIAAIDAKAAADGNLPIVFGGDTNSDATRTVKPVQPMFIKDGWFDAAAVSSKGLRTGMKVSTANGSGPQIGAIDDGYGSRPVVHPYETSRIDYILLKNSPHTYKYANVLRLHKNGTFIKSLQGTDHNMQLATIGIGNPVPAP
jgi:endonuclease/exonuclease/phosphatase family metal-dependent hydrolase